MNQLTAQYNQLVFQSKRAVVVWSCTKCGRSGRQPFNADFNDFPWLEAQIQHSHLIKSHKDGESACFDINKKNIICHSVEEATAADIQTAGLA